jgi:hypothetical protein
VVYLVGQILAPPPQLRVSVPGQAILHVRANSVAAASDGVIEVLTPPTRELLVYGRDHKVRRAHAFSAFPSRIVIQGSMTFVTTENPDAVIALHRGTDAYNVAWSARLDAAPADLAAAGDRVAVVLPSLDKVLSLSTATGRLMTSGFAGRGPLSIAAYGHELIVGAVTDGTVVTLDARTLKVVSAQKTEDPHSLRSTGDDLIVGSVQDGSVKSWNLSGQRVVRRAEVPGMWLLAVSHDRLVVATYGPVPRLIILDRRRMVPLGSIDLPSLPGGVILTGHTAICTLPMQNVVTRVRIL